MESESFAHVWRAYQAGDADAKSRIVVDFMPRIAGLVAKFLRNRNNTDDVEQSVWASIAAKRGEAIARIAKPEELWDMFAAIALRHCNKHNKREDRSKPVVTIGGAADDSGNPAGYVPVDPELPPDEQVAIADLIAECKKRLTDREQNVLGQRLADLDRRKTAKLLKISIPTVDRDLQKIRTVLAKISGASDA
ncbi:MAG: sigma factor [Acidobacteriaceae bacterium]|jgi:DNA-directed RNA polymerase specialized sigma24 family protein|nr:sigma factor [Acidobacteriaceae bacterium]